MSTKRRSKAKSADTEKRKRDGTDNVGPIRVNDYNKCMGGVDRYDARLGKYSSVRKSLKWTKKLGRHFMSFLQFKLNLIREMLDEATKVTTL